MSIRTNLRILGAIAAGETRRGGKPTTGLRSINIGLQKCDHDRIRAIAKARNCPIAHLGREIFRKYLDTLETSARISHHGTGAPS